MTEFSGPAMAEYSTSTRSDVVIVGGGVIGAACAYYLSLAGCKVTIVEQGDFGRGCSHGNCGYVCPSHVLPLAAPGALWSTLKTLMARNSPLKVRWRLDPAMWSWFWKFARRCNQKDMLAAGHSIQDLLASSRLLYDDLFREPLTGVQFETRGLLFVFKTAAAMNHYAETDQLLRNEFSLGATRFDGAALLELEPSLKPGIAGAWHYQTDGHLRPDRLMADWCRVLVERGVEVIDQCEFRDFRLQGDSVKEIITSKGNYRADQVVIATGAWTPQLRQLLRCPIPIQPGKGYSLTLSKTPNCPRLPMIFEEHRVAITPLNSSYRIGSTMEFAGYDSSLNPDRLQLLRDGAALYLKDPIPTTALESWWGWRPMTPDGLPLIGRVPALKNVIVAAGHGMLGVSMSPATGRLVAELLTNQTPHLDPRPYAVGRA